ncbi:MAG: AzlD domain-containing protein [Candidatus Promineifilaceae bacterium]
MSFWLIMLVVGLFTFATRLSFILLFGRYSIPNGLQRALRFVPPAALTAIILPELLAPSGNLDISLGNFRLLAGLLAILIAWRSKNIFLTILIGMAALLLLQTFF